MAVLTVMKRVKRLTASNIIRQYTITVDHEALGYDVHAIIEVRVAKGRLLEVEEHVATQSGVYAVYDHTGHFDATILARFKNTRELDRFVKQFQKKEFVERTETKLILNTIKQ